MQATEFCFRCQKVTPSRSVQHASGKEFLCAVCGWQVDFLHDDLPDEPDDYYEPVGSCENCSVNLYEDDDPEYCDQCLWMIRMNAADDE